MKKLALFFLLLGEVLAQNSARMISGVNLQVGTTYTFTAIDRTKLVVFSNVSPVAAILPAGTTAGFEKGALFSVTNLGTGTATITCAVCTINGSTTLVLATSTGADIYSQGGVYYALLTGAGGGGGSLPVCSTFQGRLCIDSSNTPGFPGPDIGAWVNSAYAGCGTAGCRIHLVSGVYTQTTPISCGTNQKVCILEGDPAGVTILNYTPTSGTAVSLHYGASHQYGAGLRDITLSGPCVTTACAGITSVGLNVIDEGDNFQNVRVGTVGQGFAIGVQYSSSFGFIDHWVNAQIYYNAVGLSQSSGKTNENVSFEGGSISANAVAMELSGGGDWYFAHVSFDDNTAANAILFDGVVGITGGFEQCHFENPSLGPATYINMTAPGFLDIRGGNINDGRTVGTNPAFVTVNGANYVSIDGATVFSNGITVTNVLKINPSLNGQYVKVFNAFPTRILSDFTSSFTGPFVDFNLNLTTPSSSSYNFGAGSMTIGAVGSTFAGSSDFGCNPSERSPTANYVGFGVINGTCTAYRALLPLAPQGDTTNSYQLNFQKDGAGNMGASWGGALTVDATLARFTGAAADVCVAISNTLTAFALYGTVVDARGFGNPFAPLGSTWPDFPCSVNPIPTGSQSLLLLPPGRFREWATWQIPNRFRLIGQGWDQNPGQGIGATVLMACTSTDGAKCNSVTFPAAPGGPLLCWQDRLGGCGNGDSSPDFDALVSDITVDCNYIAGCIAIQDMNAQEGSGVLHTKLMNYLNGGRGIEIAGGVTNTNNVTVTNASATVTGTGFLSDMINARIHFTRDGATTFYDVISVNAAGTSAVLGNPQGTTTPYVDGACGAGCVTTFTYNNGNTQNGRWFYDIYGVHLGGGGHTATTAGIAVLMNTGSGSNEGPTTFGPATFVNSNATQPDDMIRVSGCCTRFWGIHEESWGHRAFNVGPDSNTTNISYEGSFSGSGGSGDSLINVSNAFTTSNYSFKYLKVVSPSFPTNLLADAVCSNTIPTAAGGITGETNLMEYTIGSTCFDIQTTSHIILNGSARRYGAPYSNPGLTGNLSAATIYTTVSGGLGSVGMYRVCAIAWTTATGNSTVTLNAIAPSGAGTVTFPFPQTLNTAALTNPGGGCVTVEAAASSAIQISVTGYNTTGTFSVKANVEQLTQ